jgi:hypothetical protein
MTESKKVLKQRVGSLEERFNRLHALVANIAHNQEMLVEALTPSKDEVEPKDKED